MAESEGTSSDLSKVSQISHLYNMQCECLVLSTVDRNLRMFSGGLEQSYGLRTMAESSLVTNLVITRNSTYMYITASNGYLKLVSAACLFMYHM